MSRRISIRDSWKLHQNSLNYPLYLPALGPQVERSLIDGDLQGFHAEISRLATMGSRPANALLGYLHVRGAFKQGVRFDLAETHALPGAKSGDPYSQYVVAWACFHSDRQVEAVRWMAKSAFTGRFLPAVVDIAVWMASGRGFQDADARAAAKTLWLAQKNGHRTAIFYIAQMLLKGRFGLLARSIPVLLFPLLLIWGVRSTFLYPFDERTFWTPWAPRSSLFKRDIDAGSLASDGP